MLNFREEFEQIKKARTDTCLYEAEEFLEYAIKRFKKTDVELLKKIETFDVQYSTSGSSESVCYISAGINGGISFVRMYDNNTGREVFKKIEETLEKTCSDIIEKKKDHISLHV